jgi:hypothetical protein
METLKNSNPQVLCKLCHSDKKKELAKLKQLKGVK